MLMRYKTRGGTEEAISRHSLRSSFATDLYRQTKGIRLTQKALGHANLATTQILPT